MEKLAAINSQINSNSGILSQLMEGVSNSSIATTSPMTADTGMGNGNLEAKFQSPALSPAHAGCAVEQMEDESATPK